MGDWLLWMTGNAWK